MKALTVKQPWAELIVSGEKDIENRTWRTLYRGRILIHTAKTVVPSSQLADYPLPAIQQYISMVDELQAFGVTSAIIGSVEIVDCVHNHPSKWAEKGVWNWVLANPIKFERPILNINGKLSLWEYCGDIQ